MKVLHITNWITDGSYIQQHNMPNKNGLQYHYKRQCNRTLAVETGR